MTFEINNYEQRLLKANKRSDDFDHPFTMMFITSKILNANSTCIQGFRRKKEFK
jgi:hypothetical protein